MASRMNRYYDEETQLPSRQAKNMDLYREISMGDIDDFKVNSNVSIIDDSDTTKNIDIDKVREILKQRYEEEPKSKRIADYDEPLYQGVNLDETRDYDINSILEQAKEKKEVNYEVDRLKKLRNTQFDILNSLDIPKEKDEEESSGELREDQEHLMELINTITSKELAQVEDKTTEEEINPLDILTDLKGNDNTIVVPSIKEIEEEDKPDDEEEGGKAEQPKEIAASNKEEKTDDSFLSKSLIFTQSDFEDFKDLKEEDKSSGLVVKVLTILLIIILLFGIVFMLNGIFNWGLL